MHNNSVLLYHQKKKKSTYPPISGVKLLLIKSEFT